METTSQDAVLLVDTDILVLLAASGLLSDVAVSLGYKSSQLRRLAAAPYQVRRSRRLRDHFGAAVLQSVEPVVVSIAEVERPKNFELLDSFNRIVDAGEAQLMASAASADCVLMVSGDKRAVVDLAQSGCTACIGALQKKIVCLEAVLWTLLDRKAAVDLGAAFLPVLTHATLRILLSSQAVVDQVVCREGVRSYYNDLYRAASGTLFNPSPDHLGKP